MERSLTTILVGDFVGSTRQMEAAEEATLQRVIRALDLLSACVARQGGRVFSSAGDAILAEFPSPLSGLKAAIEARALLGSAHGLSPQDLRFGLHVADVVRVGDDLRGDGVNIASRLQESGQPGEIEVSGTLYDHVRRMSPCHFTDLGARRLKGMSEPLRVLRVGTTIDRHIYQNAPTVAAPNPATRPNSIAVLPFRAVGAEDDDQRFLAEGLAEDIIHELGLIRSLFVSSRTASQALQTQDPVEIGAALGVRYVLSGSLRRLGNRVRLSVTLSNSADGGLVWSDRIQRPFDELLDAMDDIVARVAATVSGRIDHAEISAVRTKRPENMTAYEYYLRGLDAHRMSPVADIYAQEARQWFQRAHEADPNFARPIAMDVCAWSTLPDFEVTQAAALLEKALSLDPTEPELHRILGIVNIRLYEDFEASRTHHETALRLAPNDAYIVGRCAAFYTFDGEPERALDLLDHAEALDPFLPVWIIEERVAALYALGRYDELSHVARSLDFQTRRSRFYRAAARVARGDIPRARDLIAEALADDPELTTQFVTIQELYRDRVLLDGLIDRLKQAGLTDPPNARPGRIAPIPLDAAS